MSKKKMKKKISKLERRVKALENNMNKSNSLKMNPPTVVKGPHPC